MSLGWETQQHLTSRQAQLLCTVLTQRSLQLAHGQKLPRKLYFTVVAIPHLMYQVKLPGNLLCNALDLAV